MISHPFSLSGKMISYGTGNPMGAYSSFASFAIAHHYILFFICKEKGISFRKCPYFLLGDDILIMDKEVATRYKEIIKILGVDFSPLKTYDSSNFSEFTKRIFYKGSEVSPFPISSLKESSKYYYTLTQLLMD